MIKQLKKYIFFSCLLSVLFIETFGQSGSAYTRIGIGDMEYSPSARRLGIGQMGVSVSDPDFISIQNPASLNMLRKTRIETGKGGKGETKIFCHPFTVSPILRFTIIFEGG